MPRFFKPHYVKGGLVLYLPCDKIVAGQFLDVSGKENHGTIHGPTLVDGKRGMAGNYDGVDDYVDCGNDDSLQITSDITLLAWVKVNTKQTVSIIDKIRGSNSGYWFGTKDTGVLRFTWGNGSAYQNCYGGTDLGTGRWRHVAATKDGANVKVYLDGVEDGSAIWTNDKIDSGDNLEIGRMYQWMGITAYWDGKIDEVRIYNRALKKSEIIYNYLGRRDIMGLKRRL